MRSLLSRRWAEGWRGAREAYRARLLIVARHTVSRGFESPSLRCGRGDYWHCRAGLWPRCRATRLAGSIPVDHPTCNTAHVPMVGCVRIGPLAQSVERSPEKREVPGSIPGGAASGLGKFGIPPGS